MYLTERLPLPRPRRLVLTFMLLAAATPLAAQGSPLSLDGALGRADRSAFAGRATGATAALREAEAFGTLRAFLPSIRLDAGFLRTTDPIGAFGITLRQHRITSQDFDPSNLNYPSATRNYTGAIVLEQPLFNVEAWIARRAALHAGAAARASAEWVRVSDRLDVIRGYYGTVLAAEKVAMLSAALRAANQHVRQAEAAAKNGLVTPSDALLASVQAGEVETQLVEAQGEMGIAKLALATIMGTPADTLFTLPEDFPSTSAVRSAAQDALAATGSEERGDVRSARADEAAAQGNERRARALYLPRVEGFARYDWNSPRIPYGGAGNWTVGVMATWSPFSGGSEIAESRTAAARSEAATAMREGAEAAARLEAARAATAIRTALVRLDIAERSVRQSTDAHRIVNRKYDGGLATVAELLSAAAAETQQHLAVASARYGLIIATAERYRAIALDPGAIAAPAITASRGQ